MPRSKSGLAQPIEIYKSRIKCATSVTVGQFAFEIIDVIMTR